MGIPTLYSVLYYVIVIPLDTLSSCLKLRLTGHYAFILIVDEVFPVLGRWSLSHAVLEDSWKLSYQLGLTYTFNFVVDCCRN